MKIILLDEEPQSRLIEAAQARGHVIETIDPSACSIIVKDGCFEVFYNNAPFPQCDAVLPRKSTLCLKGTCYLLPQLEAQNVLCVNSSQSMKIANNKLHTLLLLALHDIPIPQTGFSCAQTGIKKIISMVGGDKQITKTLWGTWGIGTILTDAPHGTYSMVETLQTTETNCLIQEYIKEFSGKSIRYIVIDSKIIASAEYESIDGNFKSNFSIGGSVCKAEQKKVEEDISIKAAQILGLAIAGVDLVRSKDGPKVLEVNTCPGIEGMELATGINIGTAMIKHIERIIGEK